MEVGEFIKQYNNAIDQQTEKIDSVDIDDFSLMDAFADIEPNSESLEEELFGFNDFDEFDELIDKSSENTDFTVEYTGNSNNLSENTNIAAKKFIEKDTYIQSVSIEIFDNKQTVSNIRETFFADLEEDDYVVGGDILSTFNRAFNKEETDEDNALLQYIHIYYGIQLNKEELEQVYNILNKDLLIACAFPYRNTDVGEIVSIQKALGCDWFRLEILKKYSLESKDTNMLIDLMKEGHICEDRLSKYSYNADVMNSYLWLEFRGLFDEDVFDNMRDNPDNLSAYVASVMNPYFNDFKSLFYRKDYCRFYSLLEDLPVVEQGAIELLESYNDSPYLYEVFSAKMKGVFNAEFIELNLREKSKIHDYMAQDYASGILTDSLLCNFKGNYYLTKAVVELRFLNLDTDMLKPLLCASESLQNLNRYMIMLLNSYIEGFLEVEDYKRYLLLLGLPQNDKLIESVLRFPQIYPFNVFWFKSFLSRVDLSDDGLLDKMGDVLLIHSDKSGKNDSFFSVQDLICRVHYILNIINDMLGSGYSVICTEDGIILCASGLSSDTVDFEQMRQYAMIANSLDNYLFNTEEQKTNRFEQIPPITKVLESNLVAPLQEYTELSPQTEKLIMDLKGYMNYDKLIGLIKTQRPTYVGIINSRLSTISLKILQKIIYLKHNGYLQLNYLNLLFSVVFGKKYIQGFSNKDQNFIDLNESLIIETVGITGYANCTMKEIINSLDDYMNKLVTFKALTIELNSNDRICIRGR